MSSASELAEYGRRAARDGLVIGASGNLSVRDDDHVIISPTGVECDRIDPDECALVPIDGGPPVGEATPSSEIRLHLGIYRGTEAGAVIHTHSMYATALSTIIDELPAIHYSIVALGGPIRVAPYHTFGTPELATAAVTALEGRRAVILAHHGIVAYGDDLAEAYANCRLVEWLAEMYCHAGAFGTPRSLSEADLAEVVQRRAQTDYRF